MGLLLTSASARLKTYWARHGRLCLAMVALVLLVESGALHLLEGWKAAVHSLLLWGGWPVFFLFTVLYNVVFVPFPYDPFLLAAPWLLPGHSVAFVGFLATCGLTLSAGIDMILGCKLGHRLHPWLRRQRGFARCEKALHTYGVAAIGLSALTPLPFSLVCWLAGMLELPWGLALLVTFLSRGVRCALVLALGGS